jgi:hypothetical protein
MQIFPTRLESAAPPMRQQNNANQSHAVREMSDKPLSKEKLFIYPRVYYVNPHESHAIIYSIIFALLI